MKVSPVRLIELLITIIAVVFVFNFFAVHFGNPDQLRFAGQNQAILNMLSGAWLLALIFAPKQLPRI